MTRRLYPPKLLESSFIPQLLNYMLGLNICWTGWVHGFMPVRPNADHTICTSQHVPSVGLHSCSWPTVWSCSCVALFIICAFWDVFPTKQICKKVVTAACLSAQNSLAHLLWPFSRCLWIEGFLFFHTILYKHLKPVVWILWHQQLCRDH